MKKIYLLLSFFFITNTVFSKTNANDDFLQKVKLEKNDDKKILAILGDRRSGDPAQLIASIKNARQKLGWNPRQSNLSTIIGSAYYALTHTAITPTLTEPNSTQNKELS